MVESFRHKDLKRLFEIDIRKGVSATYLTRIENILGLLHAAKQVADLDLPSFRLHPLSGEFVGFWSVMVRKNWRIIFRFEDGKAFDVDLLDYH